MVARQWIGTLTACVAVMIVAALIWPTAGDQIARTGAGLTFIVIGAYSAIKPENTRKNAAELQTTERSRKGVADTNLFFFRFIGIGFVFGGARLIWSKTLAIWPHGF